MRFLPACRRGRSGETRVADRRQTTIYSSILVIKWHPFLLNASSDPLGGRSEANFGTSCLQVEQSVRWSDETESKPVWNDCLRNNLLRLATYKCVK
ncbi:Hypothetical predicted protein [Cloeon dipterum]|uniref:Uncharacterized protein n=1 Tax=Cloeon dipterum TaxID=197152 RepID=A0A8S1CQY5_9INSE|nr:Hypothetical predicted protein [Cloeon dipterum]